jgi:hypothetical protein
MSFCRYYGLGPELVDSELARIPEIQYRSPDIDRAQRELPITLSHRTVPQAGIHAHLRGGLDDLARSNQCGLGCPSADEVMTWTSSGRGPQPAPDAGDAPSPAL